jgi:hypothetical protein
MSPRPHHAFTLALATALASATPVPGGAPSPAGADEPEDQYCVSYALTHAEVEAGAISEVECYDSPEEVPQSRDAMIDLATVYTGAGGSGSQITLQNTSCTGASFNFGSGHPWDNVISSTDLANCGSVKHYRDTGFSGPHELVTTGGMYNFTTLNDHTSSIEYAP